MNEEQKTKVASLMKDNVFTEQLKNVKSKGDIVELFKKNGVEISEDDLQGSMKLNEKELENIAGGGCFMLCVFNLGADIGS